MEPQNKTFIFQGYDASFEKGEVAFHYKILLENRELRFTEIISFSPIATNTSQELLKTILNNVFLMLGISYWKLYCPKNINIIPFSLSKEQADFWDTVYTKGLGEFFYKNQLDYRNLISFPFDENLNVETDRHHNVGSTIGVKPVSTEKNRSLLLVGGGKDSIVSGELLKGYDKPFTAFEVNEHSIREKTIQLLGAEKILIKRIFDPLLFSLNTEKGTYNGHIPVSAQYAFLSLLTAALYDYQYVIASNEKSANYGNVMYLGEEINHQWSKSEEFETLFQKYVHTYITSDITYFSLLRPLSEITITELFSHYPQYFHVFSSCNTNFKITGEKQNRVWCGECPKCVFVFTMLAAFLSEETVIEIFGKNLFTDETLLPLFQELLGLGDIKPFECVGTPEEMQYAMYLIHKRNLFMETIVMEMVEKNALLSEEKAQILEKELFTITNREHALPKEFTNILSA